MLHSREVCSAVMGPSIKDVRKILPIFDPPLPPGVRVRKARFIPQNHDFSKSVQTDLFLDVIYLFFKDLKFLPLTHVFLLTFLKFFLMTFFFQIFAKSLPLKIPPPPPFALFWPMWTSTLA